MRTHRRKPIPGDPSDPHGLTALLQRYLTWIESHDIARPPALANHFHFTHHDDSYFGGNTVIVCTLTVALMVVLHGNFDVGRVIESGQETAHNPPALHRFEPVMTVSH